MRMDLESLVPYAQGDPVPVVYLMNKFLCFPFCRCLEQAIDDSFLLIHYSLVDKSEHKSSKF